MAYPKVSHKIKDDLVINLDFISEIGKSALTENIEIALNDSGLPNTFVPGRNIFFLATAASVAYKKNISDLIGGMCETDYSGYPDCRLDTIRSLEDTLQKGMEKNFKIHTPLMSLSKAETWRAAENWGGKEYIEMLRKFTHTCYLEKEVACMTGVMDAQGVRPANCECVVMKTIERGRRDLYG